MRRRVPRPFPDIIIRYIPYAPYRELRAYYGLYAAFSHPIHVSDVERLHEYIPEEEVVLREHLQVLHGPDKRSGREIERDRVGHAQLPYLVSDVDEFLKKLIGRVRRLGALQGRLEARREVVEI